MRWGQHMVTEWCPARRFRYCCCRPLSHNRCGCYRSRMLWIEDVPSGCEVCYSGWTLTIVSRNCLYQARLYARAWKRCYCGWCAGSWLRRGWICEGAVQIDAASARRGEVVRLLGELEGDLDGLDRTIDELFAASTTRRIENYGEMTVYVPKAPPPPLPRPARVSPVVSARNRRHQAARVHANLEHEEGLDERLVPHEAQIRLAHQRRKMSTGCISSFGNVEG